MTNEKKCWACGDTLRVERIRWGRDATPSLWSVHGSTDTPVCPRPVRVERGTEFALDRKVVPEIRREGQRILRPGVNVKVQRKRASGTKVELGYVVECYADGHVAVALPAEREPVIVPADEWVRARQGTTEHNNRTQPKEG